MLYPTTIGGRTGLPREIEIWEDLVGKYKTSLRLARAQPSEETIAHTAQPIHELEKQEDMAQLPRLFAGR